MAKVIVVYESKYGNTKLVAETIMEGMKLKERRQPLVNSKKSTLTR